MDRKLFLTLAAFAALLLYLWLVGKVVAPFVRPLAWAVILGLSTFPLYRRLRARLRHRHLLAAAAMTVAVLLVLVLPLVTLVIFLTSEVTSLHQFLQEGMEKGGPLTLEQLRSYPLVHDLLQAVKLYLARFDLNLNEALTLAAKKATGFLLGYSTAIVRNSLAFALKLVVMVLALFSLYKDGEGFQERLWALVPLAEASRRELLGIVRNVLSAVIYGVFLTCLVQAILAGVGYWIAGLPSPVLFGVMTGVAGLIPVIGTALVWAPATAYLLIKGEIFRGIFLLVWGVVVIASSDNLIRPLFISGKGRISLLVVALGLLGGLAAFGFIGMVIGPVILSLLVAVLEIFRRQVMPEGRGEEESS